MSYTGKTDWKLDEMVYPEDMNRIEGQIEKNTSEIEGVSGKIGNPSDGEEQLTLFGKLAAILTKVLGIDTKVGTSDDTKTKPTLFGKIAGIGDTLSENLTPVTEKITEVLNKVTGVDGKIGTAADGAEQGTLFGRLVQLKNVLVEKLGEAITNITGIDNKIGTSSDPAGTETLFGQVNDISEKMPTGIVKSVQQVKAQGTGKVTESFETEHTTYQAYYIDINISSVDVNKTIVLCYNPILDNDERTDYKGGAKLLNSTKVRAYAMGYNGSSGTKSGNVAAVIQVIEFF